MSAPNPSCCSDPNHLCRDCLREQTYGDHEVSKKRQFLTNSEILNHLGLDADTDLLIPPTINWAEVKEEERRAQSTTNRAPERSGEESEHLIPPRMTW
jgi:Zn-dependent alcohol dehydrogenase